MNQFLPRPSILKPIKRSKYSEDENKELTRRITIDYNEMKP